MTVPPTPPPDVPDREEYVEEVRGPGEVYQRQVVRDQSAERYNTIVRINQFIWLIFGLILSLIGIRIILRLIGANPAAVFSQMIYGATDIFLWPFAGITADPGVGAFTLEISSIIGMIVYALLAWGITRLIWILFYRNGTSTSTVYRQDRY
jgi:hypothetical protein